MANRVPSDEVQGAGSWVGFRRALKLKHLRAVAEMATLGDVNFQDDPGASLDAFMRIGAVLSAVVLEWNWTDDDGAPLPQPKDNPAVFEDLSFEELNWLIGTMGQQVGAKNAVTRAS